MLGILLSWVRIHLVIEPLLKQTLCYIYFTEFFFGICGNWEVVKSDTMCCLLYSVEFWFIQYLITDYIRHFLVAIY